MYLSPKQEEVQKYVKEIVIDGTQEKIMRIITEESGGDRSIIELTYERIITS